MFSTLRGAKNGAVAEFDFMKFLLRSTFFVPSLIATTEAFSSDFPGRWTLSIENPEHHVIATLKVEFTDKKASSCMSGDWKVVKVVSVTTQDKKFFPTSDPLSYRVENKQLTIGRNELCDAYLWLQGPLDGASVSGDYFSLGLGGGDSLGYFKLIQAK